MASSLANAYLTLIPKLDPMAKTTIKSELDGIDTESSGEKMGGGLARGVAKAGVAIAAAAATAIAALTVKSVQAYAEYEQLVGGAKLMFGNAYDFVAQQAETAYSRVQMSANDYLTQVNGFAVGLTEALGGNEMAAAQLADKIVTAEADIVAATGNTQESVQNAFNGIMKGNYTMLDNLQLGIKPTKEGMQEVIDKVNEWNAANGNATNYVIDNYADVQSALVDYIDMVGVAGYAQMEGAETIQGALSSMSATWNNLLAGIGNADSDVSSLMDNLINTAMTAFELLVPVVEQIFTSIVQSVPSILSQIGPLVVSAIVGLVPIIVELMPQLLDAAIQLFTALIQALSEIVPILIPMLPDLVMQVCNVLIENMPILLSASVTLFLALVSAVGQIAGQLLSAIRDAISASIQSVREKIADMKQAGRDLLQGLIQGIMDRVQSVIDAVRGAVSNAIQAAKNLLGIASPSKVFKVIGVNTVEGFELGVESEASRAANTMRGAMSGVLTAADTNMAARANMASASYGKSVTYNFGDINLTADDIAGINTMQQFVQMLQRSKRAYA